MKRIEDFTPASPFYDIIYSDLEFSKIVASELELTCLIDNSFQDAKPLIEQGLIYFEDANNAHWRSGGLLYYYSFLNIAKALLVGTKDKDVILSEKDTVHGLSSVPAGEDSSLLKLCCKVNKKNTNKNKLNLFKALYKKITSNEWPFDKDVQICIRDILPHMSDLQSEAENLWRIKRSIHILRSYSLIDETEGFCRIFCPKELTSNINENINGWKDVPPKSFGDLPRTDQMLIMHMFSPISPDLQYFDILDGPAQTGNSISAVRANVNNFTRNQFQGFAFDNISESEPRSFLFSMPLNLNGKKIKWHPLLSSYIFSFILGDLLRYRPHLLEKDPMELFFVKQWCNQAPTSILREFLLFFRRVKIKRR